MPIEILNIDEGVNPFVKSTIPKASNYARTKSLAKSVTSIGGCQASLLSVAASDLPPAGLCYWLPTTCTTLPSRYKLPLDISARLIRSAEPEKKIMPQNWRVSQLDFYCNEGMLLQMALNCQSIRQETK